MESGKRPSYLFAALMVALCAILGLLQYRWIGEVSRAEADRLRGGLDASLHRLSRDFNGELTAAMLALLPDTPEPSAYLARFQAWKESSRHEGLIVRAGVAVPNGGQLDLFLLDPAGNGIARSDWPEEWHGLRDRMLARRSGRIGGGFGGGPPRTREEANVFEMPRFRRGGGGPPLERPQEIDWLVVEFDPAYATRALLPELLDRHLSTGGALTYLAKVTARTDPSEAAIYQTGTIDGPGDASVSLFEIQYEQLFRRGGRDRRGGGPPPLAGGPGPGPGLGPPGPAPGRGRWLLTVRHNAGSLDAVVNRARFRNLAVSSVILLLMLGAVAALVRYTRRAQRLAELQMEFVAGVSHELRTPLSVIRTAAHNLGDGRVSTQRQVERYGRLIADESERLGQIVEQILRFAGAKAGKAISVREPVPVKALIDDAVAATTGIIAESGCQIEHHVEPQLPPALADPTALRHALQNLITNAAKHGASGAWIGITARLAPGAPGMIELRVADHGPGIPADELPHVFDPFFRGRKALEDQVHGTGLGLNLVKKIVEALDGSVTVESRAGLGAEFVIRIPSAAPAASQPNEFADSVHRG